MDLLNIGGTTRDLLLEIGTEEIPARFFAAALAQLEQKAATMLKEARLAHGDIDVLATPRRLTLRVRAVALVQGDLQTEARGPSVKAAFTPDGQPTRAAEGFARGQGVAVTDLVVQETPQGAYVFARKLEEGRPAAEVLAAQLPGFILGLEFPKTMRWADRSIRFVRPIQWILALFGAEVIPFAVDGIGSGNATRGHRFLGSGGPVAVARASQYEAVLETEHVVADHRRRRQAIWQQVQAAAQDLGGVVPEDQALLEEVTYLVEWPSTVKGRFDPSFLTVPAAVLVTSMKGHQRYFPVYDRDGKGLLPHFVAVTNGVGQAYAENARKGCERVLRARLADARFFFEEDRKRTLASRVPDLKTIVFQEKLGTLYDKVQRVVALTRWTAQQMGLTGGDLAHAERAALLSKADQLTHVVYEFTELEGVMGCEYARLDGEPEVVATGIFEHFLPRGAGDSLPATPVGRAVALADKLDTLAGFFALGLIPTGSADPYALRRAAQGVTAILAGAGHGFSLGALIQQAIAGYGQLPGERTASQVEADLLDFFAARLSGLLRERGARYDVVDAVLAVGFFDLADALQRAETLSQLLAEPEFATVMTAFRRVANLGAKAEPGQRTVDAALLSEPQERALWQAFTDFAGAAQAALAEGRYADFYQGAVALRAPVDGFLDHVLVMAEDAAVRANRLALLATVAELLSRPADLGRLVV